MYTSALSVHGWPTPSFDAIARGITPVVTFISGNCANKSTAIRNNKGRITVYMAILCLQTNRHLDHQVVIRSGDLWRYIRGTIISRYQSFGALRNVRLRAVREWW